MLWVFVLALIMPISLGSCDNAANLAKVTWAHAVNSQDALTTTLANGKSHIFAFQIYSLRIYSAGCSLNHMKQRRNFLS